MLFPWPNNFSPPYLLPSFPTPSPHCTFHSLNTLLWCSFLHKDFFNCQIHTCTQIKHLLFVLVPWSLLILVTIIIRHISESLLDQGKYSTFLDLHSLTQWLVKINSRVIKVLAVYLYPTQFPYSSWKIFLCLKISAILPLWIITCNYSS